MSPAAPLNQKKFVAPESYKIAGLLFLKFRQEGSLAHELLHLQD